MRRIMHDRVIHVPIYEDLKLKPSRQPGLGVNTGATLTPALLIEEGEGAVSIPSLPEGEGAVSIPSPPEGERDRVRGAQDAEHAFVNGSGYGTNSVAQ